MCAIAFRLVNAPSIEAAEIVEKLAAKDVRLGLTLTALRKYIKVFQTHSNHSILSYPLTLSLSQEDQFATEFLNRDGLRELIGVISYSHGNTLAVRVPAHGKVGYRYISHQCDI